MFDQASRTYFSCFQEKVKNVLKANDTSIQPEKLEDHGSGDLPFHLEQSPTVSSLHSITIVFNSEICYDCCISQCHFILKAIIVAFHVEMNFVSIMIRQFHYVVLNENTVLYFSELE